jgi:nucleoside-diphosphate-sugar epimerase
VFELTEKSVFVAGHGGMVGSALVRRLRREACSVRTADRNDLDLTRQLATKRYGCKLKPDVVAIDLAEACIFVLKHYSGEGILNVGTGEDVSIAEFATVVAEAVGYKSEFAFDSSKPDGVPQKLLDVSKLRALDWHAGIDLKTGLARTYADFLAAGEHVRSSPAHTIRPPAAERHPQLIVPLR